jgi:hypothetical protein
VASTLTLQNSADWIRPFVFLRPLSINNPATGLPTLEPLLTSANLVQQTMLSVPFRWPFNRKVFSFQCLKQGNPPAFPQDYSEELPDFGFIEKATSVSPTISANGAIMPGTTFELQCQNGISEDNTPNGGRPTFISPQMDDNAGNITFRLMPIPDQVYTINITYQKKAPLFTAFNQTWVIPDNYSHIFHYGLMALMMQYSDDPRFQLYNQKFITHLLLACEGLDETSRNLFLNNWQAITGTPTSNAIWLQSGHQAQGNF